MAEFYVEVWQQAGLKAEQHANLPTFQDAVAWLDARLAEDSKRLPRLFGYTDAAEHTEMLRRGMAPD